jgi:hypothetical protein
MKKLLLSFFALASVAAVNAQNCTPDFQYTESGVYPDSATNLAVAMVGVPYSQTITTVTPADTCMVILFPPCTTVPIDSVVIESVTGLPPGLSIVSMNENQLNFVFPGGSTSCMLVSGTPTQAGVYPIQVSGTSYATVFTLTQTQPFDVDYYSITVLPSTVGVEELSTTKFSVKQNSPNPFSNNSTIEYFVPTAGKVGVEVRNILGELVYAENTNAQQGINRHQLSASKFTNGVYFYQINYNNSIITKRFIVNK